jgi:type II secretory pathway component PulF
MNKPGLFSRIFDRVPIQERINFARHLSLIVKAGLPVFEGLKIVEEQTESPVLKKVIHSLIDDTNSGKFLADSLQKYDYIFGNFFINMIRVGESSGTLGKNLIYLSDELKRSKDLNGRVRSAMVYPIVILVMTLSITAFLTFFIFPKLIPVFGGLNIQLPLTTRMLLASVTFLREYGILLFFVIMALVIALRVLFEKIHILRYFWHRLLLGIPVLSDVMIDVNMVTLTRVLALLLKSGIKIVEALDITANTFDNLVYRQLLIGSEEEIKKGGQLGPYLARFKNLVPPLVSGMVRIGESTGSLEDNMEYLADYYNDDLDGKLHSLTALLEPLMLLTMGLVVGFVALSIITPIYSMSQGIK